MTSENRRALFVTYIVWFLNIIASVNNSMISSLDFQSSIHF